MGASIPKPMIPIAGKPMIEHLLDRVAAAQIGGKPILVVSPEGVSFFKERLGDGAEYIIQEEAQGTGSAVKCVVDCLAMNGGVEPSHLMVLYGDHPFLSAEAIKRLADRVLVVPSALVMLTAEVPNFLGDYQGFYSWGRILRGVDGRVTGIRELKDATENEKTITEVNPAMFIFPYDWLKRSIVKIENNNASQEYYLTDLVAIAKKEGLSIQTESVDALDVMGVNSPDELARLEQRLRL